MFSVSHVSPELWHSEMKLTGGMFFFSCCTQGSSRFCVAQMSVVLSLTLLLESQVCKKDQQRLHKLILQHKWITKKLQSNYFLTDFAGNNWFCNCRIINKVKWLCNVALLCILVWDCWFHMINETCDYESNVTSIFPLGWAD